MSNIEWTEQTWNPIVGCSLVSPGCTNCYAMKMAGRLEAMANKRNASLEHYKGTAQKTKNGFAWTGKIGFNETALLKPLKRKKPTIYFVNSMSDLFHPDVSDEIRDKIFAIMALCPQHTFQILTKRPDLMREYMRGISDNESGRLEGFRDAMIEGNAQELYCKHIEDDKSVENWLAVHLPLKNVWLGTSVENQKYANERIPNLLATPAAVRFLSCEPLLGPINLIAISHDEIEGATIDSLAGFEYSPPHLNISVPMSPRYWSPSRGLSKIDWVIVGGESGKGARPMHPDWIRSIRDQCAATNTPFNFKQWGDWWPHPSFETLTIRQYNNSISYIDIDNGNQKKNPNRHTDQTMRKIGKKQSGRMLDGVIHKAMPQVQS